MKSLQHISNATKTIINIHQIKVILWKSGVNNGICQQNIKKIMSYIEIYIKKI